MKPLVNLERSEFILSETQLKQLIEPIDSLPAPSEELLGKAYLVRKQGNDGYKMSFTYRCELVSGTPMWKQINVLEKTPLEPVSGLWATATKDPSNVSAVVKLHWTDPEDDPEHNVYWSHDIIVRKRGSVPTSPNDGEIVGYSSVRNQYKKGSAFVDEIDAKSVDASDILDNLHDGEDGSEAKELAYYYNVFAVTVYDVATGTNDGCLPVLSWSKFSELVKEGYASEIVSVGDLIEVDHATFGKINFQVVDIDDDYRYDGKQHSVTFMADRVLFRGSFDHHDVAYPNGRNRWSVSNIREWLNSSDDAKSWHKSGDPYSADFNIDGTYGAGPGSENQFDGFMAGMPENLVNVISPVNVHTTLPIVDRMYPLQVEVTEDKIFLPSYEELFGTNDSPHAKKPSDVAFSDRPDPNGKFEGKQFGIYRDNLVDSRMKLMLPKFDTTRELPDSNNLSSWFTRTSSRDSVAGDIVYMVTATNRQYDEAHRDLGEDGAAITTPHVTKDERDDRENYFNPGAYRNNATPGFAPCFVIA